MVQRWIKVPFTTGEKLGDDNFSRWYQVTNIHKPIVRCRFCGRKATSVGALHSPNVPCVNDYHRYGKKRCQGAGMPGIVIRKLK
jgi:ribosomal protein S14